MSNNLNDLANTLILKGAFQYYLGSSNLNVPTVIKRFKELWPMLEVSLQLEIFESLHSINENSDVITIPYIAEWISFYIFIYRQ